METIPFPINHLNIPKSFGINSSILFSKEDKDIFGNSNFLNEKNDHDEQNNNNLSFEGILQTQVGELNKNPIDIIGAWQLIKNTSLLFHNNNFFNDILGVEMIRLGWYCSPIFENQIILIGLHIDDNEKTSPLICHGDYFYDQNILNFNFLCCFTLTNTYYRFNMKFTFEYMDSIITKVKDYIINFPETIQCCQFSFEFLPTKNLLKKQNEIKDKEFDEIMSSILSIAQPIPEIQNKLDNLTQSFPQLKLLSCKAIPSVNIIEINYELKKPDIVEMDLNFTYILNVSFVAVPLFLSVITDNPKTILDSSNQIFHKFKCIEKKIPIKLLLTLNSKKHNGTLILKNKFNNIPLLIFLSLYSTENPDNKIIEYQHYSGLNYIPRYLFLPKMPKINPQCFQVSDAGFIIKCLPNMKSKYPFSGTVTVLDDMAQIDESIICNETYSLIFIMISYENITKSWPRKNIWYKYNFEYSDITDKPLNRTLIYPVDTSNRGKEKFEIDNDFIYETFSQSYKGGSRIECPSCRNCFPAPRSCNNCYTYANRKCIKCQVFVSFNHSNLSQIYMIENINEKNESKYKNSWIHKTCYTEHMKELKDEKVFEFITSPFVPENPLAMNKTKTLFHLKQLNSS